MLLNPIGFWAPTIIATYVFSATISANTNNYNLKSAAIAAGWNQVTQLQATVTINAGVIVGSVSTGSYAFDTGVTFPSGSTLALINNGSIQGLGGVGGAGGYGSYGKATAYAQAGFNGLAGGPALRAQHAISITNNGSIASGGGGGAGMGGAAAVFSTVIATAGGPGGGGGQGSGTVAGGVGGAADGGGTAGLTGFSGSTSGAGASRAGSTKTTADKYNSCTATSQASGAGGVFGSAGQTRNSVYSTASGTSKSTSLATQPGGLGGPAGTCVVGNAYITWLATGTRYGAIT